MDYPHVIRIRQKLEQQILENIPEEIHWQIQYLGLGNIVRRKQKVAVACSSRGIANYGTIFAIRPVRSAGGLEKRKR